jgi:hypothetical protein
MLLQEANQAIRLAVRDAGGPVNGVAGMVNDGNHYVRRVGINTCDEHGWPPLGWVSQSLEHVQRTMPSPEEAILVL